MKLKSINRAAETVTVRYTAFFTYSHEDAEFGDWLYKRLESYRVPLSLIGHTGMYGDIVERLGKIFRDRLDLSSGDDLCKEIEAALRASDALIVLCSTTRRQTSFSSSCSSTDWKRHRLQSPRSLKARLWRCCSCSALFRSLISTNPQSDSLGAVPLISTQTGV